MCKAAFDVAHEEVMDEFQTSPKLYNSESALSCPTLDAPPRCPITNVVQRPDAAKCPFAQQTMKEIDGQPRPGKAAGTKPAGGCPHAAAAKAAKASQGYGYREQVREKRIPTPAARPPGLKRCPAIVQ